MASTAAGSRPSQGSAAAGPGGAAGGGSFAGRGASASSCYKCGKGGHWARDCTAEVAAGEWASGPASQRDDASKQPGQPNGSAAAAAGGGDENAAPEDGTQNPENGKKKVVRKRPKLTWEMMIGDRGIPHVYKEIPDAFRRQFKGRGHEAGDLGRLLALYDGWQKQLYPNAESFDGFLSEVERFSNQGITKMHLREMRDGVLELSGVNRTMQMPPAAEGPAGSPAAGGGGGNMMEGHDGAPELDEEELMELQAMGGGGAPMEQQEEARAGAGHGMDDEMMAEDEEPPMMQEAPGGLDEDEMAALEDEMFM